MKPVTALAFDYGTQNIGAAIGQSVTQTARELMPLKARDGIPRWEEVEKLIKEWQPDVVVVGLPLNMDDSESELCVRARKFARRLAGRFNANVVLQDERLSTREAKTEARDRGYSTRYAENPVDSIAARLILESWFRDPGHLPL